MNRYVVAASKVMLGLLIVLLLGAQALVPLVASETARSFPEGDYLQVPYAVAAIGFLACAQAVLVAAWRLLRFVSADAIFSERAFGSVNFVIRMSLVAAGIMTALFVHATFVVGAGPITLPAGLLGLAAVALAFALLMVVMRALLRSAVAMRDELSEVI